MKLFPLKFKGDKKIWILLLILAIISILSVYSSTYRLTMREGNLFEEISRHVFFLFVGFLLIYLLHNMSLKSYKLISPIVLFIMIICLIILFFSKGEGNEAKRWMFSRSFQPSDITKVAIVVYLAIVLGKNFNGSIKQFFMWTIFPVLLVCGLVIKAHTSNAVIIGATSMLMVFIGVSKRKFRLISILFVVATMTLYLCFYKDVGRGETVSKRIKAWVVTTFSPETRTIAEEKEDPKNQTAGYRQARIARYAIVSGGLFHIAPGKSVYRKILSEAHNDYIFAIIVEEYGLTGGIIVIMVYFVLFYRIIRLLKRCRKTFTALMLSGLLIMIVLPTCIHIGVAVGGLPVVGQNLPMISTGGTSIITTSIAFGMILAVSRIAEEEEKEKELQKSKTEK